MRAKEDDTLYNNQYFIFLMGKHCLVGDRTSGGALPTSLYAGGPCQYVVSGISQKIIFGVYGLQH